MLRSVRSFPASLAASRNEGQTVDYGNDQRELYSVSLVIGNGRSSMRQGWFLWRILGLAALSLAVCGCPGTSPPAADQGSTAEPATPLRLVVVDDPGLAEAVQRQWQARAEGELEVRKMTSEEICDPRRKRLAADAVIYPSGLIGELAERGWIAPLSDDALNSPEFARRDIFDHLRQHEIMWGEQTYAAPSGHRR